MDTRCKQETYHHNSTGDFSLEQFSNDDIVFYMGFHTYNALLQCLSVLNVDTCGENIRYLGTSDSKKRPGSRMSFS